MKVFASQLSMGILRKHSLLSFPVTPIVLFKYIQCKVNAGII